ncbi:restriction endonuclease subunit S [Lysobacter sp. Hz 25]|uniref:restriction endonuclease subunit S n=1 Tax=Lysobacter sp. Hz 25 TaxID=3383698 RepID=UPI0038D4D7E3
MKLETFFEKFEQFTEAPDAVAKMRELVLQLAMQGKLVEQKPAEGDVSALLEAIAVARKNGHAKASKEIESEDSFAVEGWHQVPASWRWVPLRAIGDIVGGGTPRSDNSDYFADDGIPWLTPADLNGFKEKRILRGRRCITKKGLEESSARLLPIGSVLFSSRAPIGYVAISGTNLATNQGFKSCVPFITETNEFLYYYLKSAAARIDREASGTTFREVSGKIVSQIPVPLAPLAEQKRIVAKVDELMALCDLLEDQQQERAARRDALVRASLARFAGAPTPANLNSLFHSSFSISPSDLRKLILTLAVQGKLVAQDSDDEPLEDSAECDSLFDLPPSWRWQPLGTLGLCRTGKTPPTSDPENYGEGFPFIGPGQITVSGRFTAAEKSITAKGLANSTEASSCDILMVCIGGSIGKAAICRESIGFNQQINSLRLKRDVPEFIYIAVTADYFQDQVRESASGSATPIINKGKWERIPVPIPPVAEQRRIVAKMDELMTLVDSLEAQLATARAAAANLLAAAVAELTYGKEADADVEV